MCKKCQRPRWTDWLRKTRRTCFSPFKNTVIHSWCLSQHTSHQSLYNSHCHLTRHIVYMNACVFRLKGKKLHRGIWWGNDPERPDVSCQVSCFTSSHFCQSCWHVLEFVCVLRCRVGVCVCVCIDVVKCLWLLRQVFVSDIWACVIICFKWTLELPGRMGLNLHLRTSVTPSDDL